MTNIKDLCGSLRIYLASLALCAYDEQVTLSSETFLNLIKIQLALISYIQNDIESYEEYMRELPF